MINFLNAKGLDTLKTQIPCNSGYSCAAAYPISLSQSLESNIHLLYKNVHREKVMCEYILRHESNISFTFTE
ncbi:MAG: hypothetical protein ACK6DA_00325 [Candidatus Kapaibacterium sp.]